MGDAINEVAPAYRSTELSAAGHVLRPDQLCRDGHTPPVARPRLGPAQRTVAMATPTRSSAQQQSSRMSVGAVGELPAGVVVALASARRPAGRPVVDPASRRSGTARAGSRAGAPRRWRRCHVLQARSAARACARDRAAGTGTASASSRRSSTTHPAPDGREGAPPGLTRSIRSSTAACPRVALVVVDVQAERRRAAPTEMYPSPRYQPSSSAYAACRAAPSHRGQATEQWACPRAVPRRW